MEDDAEAAVGPDDGYLLVRIHVPELNVHKCLQFPKDQLVWDVKQQCLAALPKVASWYRELKESFNYGLFCPPVNGKAGKFLDEERRLGDYPFNGPVGYLELKAKRRVYKMVNLDEKQLKALHTRTNLRRFLEYVTNAQVEKINKMCSKGLDPNFHCPETGETPLTMATGVRKPTNVLKALVNGGALLDFRSKDGSTAVHRAVEHNSLEAVTTLLELGASPNYRDCKGLTPLYVAITHSVDPLLCETLLHNRAVIGAQDLQGWQEVHQACRNGLVQHLEHLLYYGADMNARNASGNTPLHVCAVNGQESCARVLLFRGCQHDALNYANQTPYQVAVIAGNLDLADVIQAHRPENVDKSLCDTSDIISDSSGVGTANSDSLTLPGTSVVCVENYSSSQPGHLRLSQGDILDVTGTTDCGLLEGTHRNGGETGLFPPHCVQEVRLRGGLVPPPQLPVHRRVVGRRESNATSLKHFATAPRHKKQLPAEPRTVVLHRARRGFGFVLRGAKATSPLMELTPSARYPALQYLDDVDKGGVADMAGLRKNDYLLAINGEDVSAASHEHVVDLIRKSGDLVSLTVVSSGALPSSKSAAAGLTAGQENQPTPRQYQTLPRKLNNNFPTLGRAPAPLPPRRDPKTTLSVGRARAKSMVAEEEAANSGDSTDPGKVQPRTASIRARPTSSRITAAELESLFQRQTPYMMTTSNFQAGGNSQPSSPARTPRVYASVAEMKRSKGKANTRVRFSLAGIGMAGVSELHRDFHSTPDLAAAVNGAVTGPRQHHSQEELRPLPPPSHPPPPPPAALDTGHDTGNGGDGVMSSFKPAASAKLYASPEDVKNVGYRSRSLPSHANRPQVRKSHSLRSPSSSFKPAPGSQGANPYAQPIRNRKQQPVSAPPIPDPDYSLSENESDTEPADKTVIRVNQTEGSGGSSTSSGSLPHSFSVDEIQKVRTQLKSSKSYPNDFIPGAEDGDNSSSGVSSDQEIPAGPPSGFDVNQESSTGTSTLPRTSQRSALTRNAVSLAQLPPPLEADTDEREELVVPPPPEYAGGVGPVMEEVLAPPPQFSDGRLVTRVRIVGSTPKAAPSRLHSQ
ncbi:SH3 and multiple ankyrin repeat domains protein 1-like isoform X6 [Macrosteles quadrilineatus]|uniref:SH3 and multiple ankyrin repeat domains protein 1-like isoform X6 n=1 Tax=Macrosteles quadrilineatus TaxID=74068 RepID=UPI0023E1F65E|nr:SH3 and multiple ankyrin repeat domains protein 1-like isoform X6 [Macrosteles quadrilineatus]